jgi:hypothetical protein
MSFDDNFFQIELRTAQFVAAFPFHPASMSNFASCRPGQA